MLLVFVCCRVCIESDLDFGVEEDSGFVPLGRGGASSSSAAPTAAAAASSSVPGRPRTDARGHTIVASSTLSIDQLPERFRCVFPYPRFNRVQTTCFHAAFNTDKNVIVSAPTGQRRGKRGRPEAELSARER